MGLVFNTFTENTRILASLAIFSVLAFTHKSNLFYYWFILLLAYNTDIATSFPHDQCSHAEKQTHVVHCPQNAKLSKSHIPLSFIVGQKDTNGIMIAGKPQ